MSSPRNTALSRPRFGLDGAPCVFDYPPGVARVARELIRELVESQVVDCVPLIPAEDDEPRTWRHRELPRLERQLGLDGILSFTSAFPIRGKGLRIQTIHELPWRNGVRENAGRGHKFWAKHGRRRASKIIVPSQHVYDDLCSFAPRAAAQAQVIPWAVGQPFLGQTDAKAKQPDAIQIPTEPFFLSVGGTRSKKRLEAAIHGLAPFGSTGPSLLVTGAVTTDIEVSMRLATTFGIEKRVRFLGEITDEQLASLYPRAVATLALAFSEGFGFPVLESMAAGTNVLHPPLTAQAELIGDLGTLVVPDLPDSMAKGIEAALAEANSEAGGARREARIQRAQEFTWSRTAAAVESILLEAVQA